MRLGVMVGAIATASLIMAGCASKGVNADRDFPQSRFEVQTDYEAAHRRSAEYLRVCFVDAPQRYGVQYVSSANVDLKGTLGTLQLSRAGEANAPMIKIESEPYGEPRRSWVTVTVLGDGQWDQRVLDSAARSITSATPVCPDQTAS